MIALGLYDDIVYCSLYCFLFSISQVTMSSIVVTNQAVVKPARPSRGSLGLPPESSVRRGSRNPSIIDVLTDPRRLSRRTSRLNFSKCQF